MKLLLISSKRITAEQTIKLFNEMNILSNNQFNCECIARTFKLSRIKKPVLKTLIVKDKKAVLTLMMTMLMNYYEA